MKSKFKGNIVRHMKDCALEKLQTEQKANNKIF